MAEEGTVRKGGFLRHFVAGTVGGWAQTLVGHPLDTVKLRLQTQKAGSAHFRGPMDVIAKTVRREGMLALFKGVGSPMVGIGFLNALLFSVYGHMESTLRDDTAPPGARLPLAAVLLAGGTAGAVNSVISCPVELVKSRLQVQYHTAGEAARYTGSLDCARQIARSEGVRGLYRGLVPTVLRETPLYAVWYGVYETARRAFAGRGGDVNTLHPAMLVVSGALGGVTCWLLPYPVDTVKSRIQTSAPTSTKYRGVMHSLRVIVREEGVRGLYVGLSPTLARALPAAGSTFLFYELTMRALQHV